MATEHWMTWEEAKALREQLLRDPTHENDLITIETFDEDGTEHLVYVWTGNPAVPYIIYDRVDHESDDPRISQGQRYVARQIQEATR